MSVGAALAPHARMQLPGFEHPLRLAVERMWSANNDSATIARILRIPEADVERIRVAIIEGRP